MNDHIPDATKMISDTPRTNLEAFFPHESMYQVCDADFCRKLERQLNAANERIKRLEEAGDEMYKFINPPSPCMRTTRMDNLLQGWDDAKININ
jgi:hypothetical protein